MKLWGIKVSSPERRDRTYRHEFVIGPLTDSPLFGRKARRYYCIRCNWQFLVSEKRVVVLGEDGAPLNRIDSVGRFDTFEEGPCPALAELRSRDPIKAYIVNLEPRRKPDERRSVVTSNFHPWTSRPWPLLRVFSRLREGLGRHA
jgi:hypothetical protein